MDGHFVPNISFGLPVIASLRSHTELPFDCHLMTTNPDAFLPELAAAGVDLVTMHIEAIPDPDRGDQGGAVQRPRLWAGHLAANPVLGGSSVHGKRQYAARDVGESRFRRDNPSCPRSCRRSSRHGYWIESHGLEADIEIDGGISSENIISAKNAGATVFVAGTSVFGAPDPAEAIRGLRRMIEGETWIQE